MALNCRNEHYVGTYFWFMGDLFIVCFFATSFVSAYRYIHLRYKLELDKRHNKEQIREVIQARIYKNVACKYILPTNSVFTLYVSPYCCPELILKSRH